MSKTPVQVGPEARKDLRKLVLWLRQEADAETATRFSQATIDGFQKIADSPGIGPAVPTTHPALFGLRKWRVPGFPMHLIFYRQSNGRAVIVRVLHASQDWWSLLDVN